MTPLLARYQTLKAANPDALCLIRVTQFYDSFGPDAEIISQALGVPLTAHKSKQPMVILSARMLPEYRRRLAESEHRLVIEGEGQANPQTPTPSLPQTSGTLFAGVE